MRMEGELSDEQGRKTAHLNNQVCAMMPWVILQNDYNHLRLSGPHYAQGIKQEERVQSVNPVQKSDRYCTQTEDDTHTPERSGV